MSLPTGVVTFIFSDIEGSTRWWEADPDGMRRSLARHDELTRAIVESCGGHVFKHTGDGFGAAFESASAGVEAAAGVAAAMKAEPWEGPALRCRIGVHSGVAEPQDGDYFGATVTRTARVMDAGNGGQILISDAARRQLHDRIPPHWTMVDAGEHRLKDLGEPLRLYRLVGAGAEDDRQLRTLETAPHNLPVQLSSFIGREVQIKEVSELVRGSRLVTLTGIGGVGKTRLSLQVAAEVLADFPDGVWFVELASLAEAGLLADTVASALRVVQDATVDAMERVLSHLASRRALVVVDNCEHLIDEVAGFADELLRSCPDVHVLATSREGLAVTGEVLWRVPSLRVDDDAAAVELFGERARLVRPEFAITSENRARVADLCLRLDGIPLAIELATARLKMLSVEQVAEHLGDRFRLLTGGSRTAVERQRTLRAMMDWSYDLLWDAQQTLLRRLAVFCDGFSYEAAEEACSGDSIARFEVLDLLGHLVEASLVTFEDERGVPRYRLLETVRQYSLDKLFDAGEADQARFRHAAYMRDFAQRYDDLVVANKEAALVVGELELCNIRAALTWALEAGEGVLAVEIAGGFRQHFWNRVMYDESVRWLRAALRMVDDDASPRVPRAVANALTDAGNMDNREAQDELEPRAQRIYESTGDPEARGELANALATGVLGVDLRAADELEREAHTALRAAGSDRWVYPLQNRCISAIFMNDSSAAEELLALVDDAVAEGLAGSMHPRAIRLTFATLAGEYDRVIAETAAEPSDDWEEFWLLHLRSIALRSLGRLDEAHETIDQAASVAGKFGKAFTGWGSAMLEIQRGDVARAIEAFAPLWDAGDPRNLVGRVDVAMFAALVAAHDGRPEDSAVLFGFGEALAAQVHRGFLDVNQRLLDAARAMTQSALGDSRFEELVASGASTAWEALPLQGIHTR